MKNLIISIIIAFILCIANSCSNDDLPEVYFSDYLGYSTKTELELPFNEEWFVFWGGRGVAENYHAAYKEQRFAYDLVQKINGSSYANSGSQNQDYHCFGKPLNAPGAGVITAMTNNIHDNVPGQFNRDFPIGNYVIIDHENGEFSILAHFKEGSIIVAVGDTVLKGQELGKAGNSGNSSEPHLHYHMQTTADPFNGEGLPTQFINYFADDVLIEKGEPVQSQSIINSN